MIDNISNDGKITLFLMTEKGFIFLKKTLTKYKSMYGLVVVGSDKSLKKDFESEIIKLCDIHSIKYIRKNDLKKINTEYVIAVSWRWLIKYPEDKIIVFHDSILPKYRGFSPLVNALIRGESEIGVSAIFGASDYDGGRIIVQSKSSIVYPITIHEAIKIINKNYLTCAEYILKKLSQGQKLSGQVQDEALASYSVWLDDDDYYIDWNQPASYVKRFIDSIGYPYKGAKTILNMRQIVRILSAEEAPDVKIENRHIGKVLFSHQGKPTVICGSGLLTINDGYIEDGLNSIPMLPLENFRTKFGSKKDLK